MIMPVGVAINSSLSGLQEGIFKGIFRIPEVCFWLLADIQRPSDLRPPYPRKRTFEKRSSNFRKFNIIRTFLC